MAVAFFNTPAIYGEVMFVPTPKGVRAYVLFSRMPKGLHGLHIHRAGDLRGEGCKGACDHFHLGEPMRHGGPPGTRGQRHTGDLGNVTCDNGTFKANYYMSGVTVSDLYGRSIVIHADPDDYGRGEHTDSATTGHSGARIACEVIGRVRGCL